MENLSIQDGPPGPTGPPPVPQLPPQLFTTAASLLELTDKKLLITLRDGRKLTGILRSWDQYGNLVLQSTTERRYLRVVRQKKSEVNGTAPTHIYSNEEKGIYLVRGENIVLMGEIDLDLDDTPPPPQYTLVSARQLHAEEKRMEPLQKKKDAIRAKKLLQLGFEEEHRGDILL